jgi:hypothetical protein
MTVTQRPFNTQTLPPPVIIIGSHRSGTSLVTRWLREAGVFLGRNLDPNLESTFFIELNNFVLRCCGGSWDRPAVMSDLLAHPTLREAMQAYLARRLARRGRFLPFARAARPTALWGWKDPRATLTLPLWLALFPQARIVWVSRHGVDVAQSLLEREQRNAADIEMRFTAHRNRWQDRRLNERMSGAMQYSFRCLTLEGAWGVWCDYQHAAQENTKRLSEQRLLRIRYENLAEELPALLQFCDLNPTPETLQRLSTQFDGSRILAYRRDANLVGFAERHAELLGRFGY